MIRTLGQRGAALGYRLAVGVCLLLYMAAPALAAEAQPGGEEHVVGILAAIAVPNFISYRDRSRIAAGVGTAEGIRAAGPSTPPEFDSALRGFTSPLHRSGIDKNMEPPPDEDIEDPMGLGVIFIPPDLTQVLSNR
jgi:hypothetical protein